MHRCQVKMSEQGKPDTSMIACGDHATKKIGDVWMCDYHFASFQHVEEYIDRGRLKSAMDCKNTKD